MQIDPSKRTHAQNRFLRRLHNKHGSPVPLGLGLSGDPIPGPLTPTEIAHKARRRAHRLQRAINACISLPNEIAQARLHLATLSTKTDSESHSTSTCLQHKIKTLTQSLAHFTSLRSKLS